jgi:hypothetical protein
VAIYSQWNSSIALEPGLSRRSPGLYLVLGVTAVSFAAITAYAAAGVTAYVRQPKAAVAAHALMAEPQASNRMGKSDRTTLLRNSPSYTDFDPSLLALAFARLAAGSSANPGSASGLLNDAQIAGIESRLRLTPRQAEYWPAVAVALRDIGHRYFPARRPRHNAAPKLDIQSPEVQRLIASATPLILQLSEDQKREVRQLVRIIGLEKVAAQI